MSNKKVWFVTGASKGLGLTLVKQLLAEGYNVAATSRSAAGLQKAVGESGASFLPLQMDITNENSVQESIEKVVGAFGGLDVVVNNAGYGLIGGLEELTDAEARNNFEVNVFGVLNVVRKALPYLRTRQSGHIFNISSIGGFSGNFPGFGIYCATKFAVDGLTESLAAEMKPFGVNVTTVKPGYFRTNFLTEGSLSVPANPIEAYENVRASQAAHQSQINNQQPGDPLKAAKVMISIAEEKNPPLHLFLGADAYNVAAQKIEMVQNEMKAWQTLATSTNFE